MSVCEGRAIKPIFQPPPPPREMSVAITGRGGGWEEGLGRPNIYTNE